MRQFTSAILVLGWFGALWGVGKSAAQDIPPGYELIQVSNDADYDGPPSINNCGQIVFSKRIDQGFDTEEIFLWEDGVTTRITNDSVRDAFPQINDNGTIVWSRGVGPNGELQVAMYRDGEISILTDVSGPGIYCSSPQLNNLDHVVWNQFTGVGCSESDIFYFDGEQTAQITNGGYSNQGESINDAGQISWVRFDLCESPNWVSEIMLYSDEEAIQITDDGLQLGGPDLTSDGSLYWSSSAVGIERWSDGFREVVVSEGSGPRVNDDGEFVFIRWVESNSTWQSFLYQDGSTLQLTVDDTWNSGGMINNHGVIALERGEFPMIDIVCLSPFIGLVDSSSVDAIDLELFDACTTGPETQSCLGPCELFDLDGDDDVDFADFGILQLEGLAR